MNSISILNTPVHPVTMAETMALCAQFVAEPRLHQICTTNPEFIMRAQDDAAFRQLLWDSDLCVPDGVGLLLAGKWIGRPFPERVPGSEMVYHLAKQCAENRWRLFLLGAAEGIAAQAGRIFQEKYPDLIIAGTYAGSPSLEENETIVSLINESRADILYVAYGNPKQDMWIGRNKEALKTVRVAIGIGASLDFVTGNAIRAPRWMQKLGLEWLHRLILEPWRWRRMLALPRFVFAVAKAGTGQGLH